MLRLITHILQSTKATTRLNCSKQVNSQRLTPLYSPSRRHSKDHPALIFLLLH
uniref:Uncharacterized protein n=1 Tax=Manihot esculenta TaxID=3983 RepID=A0A2C9U0I3_MANES